MKMVSSLGKDWIVVFSNIDWRHKFPEAFVRHLPRVKSDHCPLLISLQSSHLPCANVKPFRFQAMWLLHPTFRSFVVDKWANYIGNILQKTKDLSKALADWNKDVFGCLFRNKKKLLARIGAASIPDALNDTLITLVPEVASPSSVAQQIVDNIIVAQEVLHKFRNSKGKKGFITWKIDLSKAYDRLHWDFIYDVLWEIGIRGKLLVLIMQCIKSVRYQAILNGELTERFSPSAGIRQGVVMRLECGTPLVFLIKLLTLSLWILKTGFFINIKASFKLHARYHLVLSVLGLPCGFVGNGDVRKCSMSTLLLLIDPIFQSFNLLGSGWWLTAPRILRLPNKFLSSIGLLLVLDVLKINVDGSCMGEMGSISAGGIIRDSTGRWIKVLLQIWGVVKILEAELWGVFRGFTPYVERRMTTSRLFPV
ncbi:hypothetical protein L3X38_024478 [Prunus dulcis]|uniref:Reverse transcriptase domain-containing protein n=1 Tax=Prunus dulcis TaxID=3755 RepID=A0AAD4Z671_PRUDU|nr:hypothetical protein L3X38_024478 [Prunus dulcis]